MKAKFLPLAFAIVLFTSCNKEQRYTQNSPEIDIVKTLIKNYNNKAYDMNIYADTAKTFYNSSDKFMSPTETIEFHKSKEAMFSSRAFSDKDPEYEMVLTDQGETWVNCWLDWEGTLAANNKAIKIPIHLTYRFINSKIIREVGMWDPTEIVLSIQEVEAAKALAEETKNLEE